mgnify:CR=1 FL=1
MHRQHIKRRDLKIQKLKNHKMRFIRTRFGFFIAQLVEREIMASGAILYKPIFPLDEETGLGFHIRLVNTHFQNFSGLPIRNFIPSLFYFNNKDENGTKSFPSLSLHFQEYLLFGDRGCLSRALHYNIHTH